MTASEAWETFKRRGPENLSNRVPHLDGVRAVAILLVFVDHLLAGVFPTQTPLVPGHPIFLGGGFTGVQLFFSLSGYLITGLLLSELERTGGLQLVAFYKRRLRRLYPVLVAAVLVYMVVGQLVGHSRPAISVEAARVLTYTSNITPLWQALPSTGWLSHAWSLGVEEQFYLVWPVMVLAAWRWGRNGVGVAAVIGSAVAVAWRLDPPYAHAPYLLLRWDALLLGALLAAVRPKVHLWLACAASLAFAAQSCWPVDEDVWWTYLLADVGSVGVLALAPSLRGLEHPWMVHVGRISYSLYIWHVFFMRLGLPGWLNLLGSLALAEVSFRLVEAPFMHMRPVGARA